MKRRSLGKEACDSSRVVVNGLPKKPSFRLSVGDIVEIQFGVGILKFKVLELKETVRKEEAQTLYQIIED